MKVLYSKITIWRMKMFKTCEDKQTNNPVNAKLHAKAQAYACFFMAQAIRLRRSALAGILFMR
jgi:hypothetical protein